MDIDRKIDQGDAKVALERVSFCLDEIEKLTYTLDTFFKKTWGKRLTYEEIIGALVAAEQILKQDLDLYDYKEYAHPPPMP